MIDNVNMPVNVILTLNILKECEVLINKYGMYVNKFHTIQNAHVDINIKNVCVNESP